MEARRHDRWTGRCSGWAAALVLVAGVAACGDGDGPVDPDDDEDPTPGVNQPPTAAFSADGTGGAAPYTVTFDAGASTDPDGDVVGWAWVFGDGETGSGRSVTHTYQRPGFFTPRLTVTDNRGATDMTVDSALVVTAAPGTGDGVIAGVVWFDRDGDGVRGPGEDGVPGMVVYLDADEDGARGAGEVFTVTDRSGAYRFEGVDTSRSWLVGQELGLGWTNTAAGGGPGGAPGGQPALITGTVPASSGPARVIGGTVAGDGEFPFMVTLLVSGVSSNQAAFTCGGTFLNSRWILTAAHCVAQRQPADFDVLVGTTRLTAGGERVGVRTIRIFPAYGANSFVGNDVAVMELERGFLVPRVDLATPSTPGFAAPGTPAVAAGWGRTVFGGSISTDLRQVALPLISNGECQRLLDESVVASTICAGQLGTSRSICNGDSGGPLMVQHGPRWVQVGVTSFGANCQPPVAFARVSEFAEWIERQVPAEISRAVEVVWEGAPTARVDFGNFR